MAASLTGCKQSFPFFVGCSGLGDKVIPGTFGGRFLVLFMVGLVEDTGLLKGLKGGADGGAIADGVLAVCCDAADFDDMLPAVFNQSIWVPFLV